ncbi:hypothetical protein DPMN_056341 [Dreissena polymorpha]|uniref:Uncharacterized protein n=1 Tax=Dreissena polymorpha TaxID=45954 RepID=A0A9D4CTG5_DREPO|nr:hypothetical protein DPMN_056341 [Dreissena polymorpha]
MTYCTEAFMTSRIGGQDIGRRGSVLSTDFPAFFIGRRKASPSSSSLPSFAFTSSFSFLPSFLPPSFRPSAFLTSYPSFRQFLPSSFLPAFLPSFPSFLPSFLFSSSGGWDGRAHERTHDKRTEP